MPTSSLLIVDHDTDLLLALGRMVCDYGLPVITAATAAEAMRAMTVCPPKVVLMGDLLPDVRPDSLTWWIRQQPALRDVPVLREGDTSSAADSRGAPARTVARLARLGRVLRDWLDRNEVAA